MSDLTNLGTSLTNAWNDVISYFRGKVAPTFDVDAAKALADAQKVIDGAYGVATDAPNVTGFINDLLAMAASGSLLVASRGADLPEYLALLGEIKDLASRIDKAVTDYQVATAVVASTPRKPGS